MVIFTETVKIKIRHIRNQQIIGLLFKTKTIIIMFY